MSNFKMSDVKQYKEWGKNDAVISKLMKQDMFQPSLFATGYYSAPSWNWAYQFGIVKIGGKLYEVMTRFGSIEGGREMYVVSYTVTGKRTK